MWYTEVRKGMEALKHRRDAWQRDRLPDNRNLAMVAHETKNDESDDFSDSKFESIFEAGVPQGPPQSISSIKKWLVEHIS